ncbi:hypothetical protein Leryth_015907 [Lithospermum erythrorhizon]|nr:hypothetical protein Leryth_015907 [Lithospermum erythrorhizon]
MSNCLCFSPVASLKPRTIPVPISRNSNPRKVEWIKDATQCSKDANCLSFEVKASGNDQDTATKRSILCGQCEGNGVVQCKQCEGSGVNSVDHFNGRFKAGGLCWLCRGKKDILCGNCNGAGFMGGFMSSMDD